jgi:hypothetical protein
MSLLPLYLESPIFISLQESTGAFDDLGLLLLVGVVGAIVLALGFTVVRFRMRDKKPQTSRFISIGSAENDKPRPKL